MIDDTQWVRPRRRLRPEQRRDELLDAAAAIILEAGADAMTMDGVATAAGVNKALLYHYFTGRDGLLAALQERSFLRLRSSIVEAVDHIPDPVGRLHAMTRSWLDPSVDGQLLVAINDGATCDALEALRIQQGFATGMALSSLLRECRPVDQADALAVAGVFLAGIAGFVIAWRMNAWSLDVAIDRYVTMLLGALEAAPLADDPRS